MANKGSSGGWVPTSCTLPTIDQSLRVAEFDELFESSVVRWARPSATALDLTIASRVEASARDIANREVGCCSFFTFDFQPAADGVLMRIGVPTSHVDVLDALQGRVSSLVRTRGVANHG